MSKAIEAVKEMFNDVKEAALTVAPGLADFKQEVGAEIGRLGVQGSMEAAAALFNGSAFVPYGPGAYTADQKPDHGLTGQEQGLEQQHERGGMSR